MFADVDLEYPAGMRNLGPFGASGEAMVFIKYKESAALSVRCKGARGCCQSKIINFHLPSGRKLQFIVDLPMKNGDYMLEL